MFRLQFFNSPWWICFYTDRSSCVWHRKVFPVFILNLYYSYTFNFHCVRINCVDLLYLTVCVFLLELFVNSFVYMYLTVTQWIILLWITYIFLDIILYQLRISPVYSGVVFRLHFFDSPQGICFYSALPTLTGVNVCDTERCFHYLFWIYNYTLNFHSVRIHCVTVDQLKLADVRVQFWITHMDIILPPHQWCEFPTTQLPYMYNLYPVCIHV